MKTTTSSLLAATLMAGSVMSPSALADQRRQVSSSQTQIQSCREAEAGERCQRRNGDIVTKPDHPRSNTMRPEVDDEVVVDFEPGDPRRPVVNDQLYNGQDAPPERGETQNFGGQNVGDLRISGHDVDGMEQRPANFGGEDIGFVRGHLEDAPEPLAMDCEDCDSDEDLPQEPVPPTNGGGSTTAPPADDDEPEEDCFWNNPAGGPDQDNCDE